MARKKIFAKKLSHEKFIQSITALSGMIVVLILTVVTYMSLAGQPINTFTEADSHMTSDTLCNTSCAQVGEIIKQSDWTRVCEKESELSPQLVWKCYNN